MHIRQDLHMFLHRRSIRFYKHSFHFRKSHVNGKFFDLRHNIWLEHSCRQTLHERSDCNYYHSIDLFYYGYSPSFLHSQQFPRLMVCLRGLDYYPASLCIRVFPLPDFASQCFLYFDLELWIVPHGYLLEYGSYYKKKLYTMYDWLQITKVDDQIQSSTHTRISNKQYPYKQELSL